MQIVFVGIGSHIVLFIALLMGAFILKPFITFVLLRITGYQQKTSFHVSTSLAQLSEFSLIIGMLGVSRGILDQSIFSTVILATIISMSATPYFINYKEYSYKAFKYPLKLFRFFPQRENLEYKNIGDEDILIIGSHRMGGVLMKKLLKHKERLLVIDYNPEIISHLIKKKVSCIYGDITSPEILNKVNIKKLKLVVSTVPNFRENLHLLRVIKSINPRTEVIVTGSRISETIRLYNKGADYVITPKILAGEELTRVIRSNKKTIRKLKNEHLKHLRDIHNLFY
ncbi:NAD-binding protein [Candidatus Dependentiae bacterium]|nr:NAD-binding protein [Candidatus Dependentiae bacterium]